MMDKPQSVPARQMTDAHRWELERLLARLTAEEVGHLDFPLIQAVEAALELGAAEDAIRPLRQQLEKGERVFQAVVYAFEGNPAIPDDLLTHGFVRRGMRFRAEQGSQIAELKDQLAALRAAHAQLQQEDWQPIETAPEKGRVLLTNNLLARDAYGGMSHVWIGHAIRREDGEWVTFDDRDVLVRNLTHWRSLPAGPEQLATARAALRALVEHWRTEAAETWDLEREVTLSQCANELDDVLTRVVSLRLPEGLDLPHRQDGET